MDRTTFIENNGANVLNAVHDAVQNIFLDYQKDLKIPTGDLDIQSTTEIDNLEVQLADKILDALLWQKRNAELAERNKKSRIQMVKAMDYIARCLNDEEELGLWLALGVADEDIKEDTKDEDLECYIQDNTFRNLMKLFLELMRRANKNGGLYCGGVVAGAD